MYGPIYLLFISVQIYRGFGEKSLPSSKFGGEKKKRNLFLLKAHHPAKKEREQQPAFRIGTEIRRAEMVSTRDATGEREKELTGIKRYGVVRSNSSQALPYLALHRWRSLMARWVIMQVKKSG